MNLENLAYSGAQIAHNFGAVGVVGGSAAALWFLRHDDLARYRLAWLIIIAWSVQIISGAGFAGISYYNYGKFPDLKDIAIAALIIKVICAAAGLFLIARYTRTADQWSSAQRHTLWRGMFALGSTALTAAAFLRWFS